MTGADWGALASWANPDAVANVAAKAAAISSVLRNLSMKSGAPSGCGANRDANYKPNLILGYQTRGRGLPRGFGRKCGGRSGGEHGGDDVGGAIDGARGAELGADFGEV